MGARDVAVFFYGSYMNRAVLAEVNLAPLRWEPATLSGFELRIAPRANLVRVPNRVVYGILAAATHAELQRLYAHSEHVLGQRYLPEAVIVHDAHGAWLPALCYIASDMPEQVADHAYVERIMRPAREQCFPDWYLAHIASFAPRA